MAFITADDIEARTKITVEEQSVLLAQIMIEAWVGRTEVLVVDSNDKDILTTATMFQALYVEQNLQDMLQQPAVKQMTIGGDSTYTFDTSMFAPYMSPWAIKVCSKLSWLGNRSITTGPIHHVPNNELDSGWSRA